MHLRGQFEDGQRGLAHWLNAPVTKTDMRREQRIQQAFQGRIRG